MEAESQQQDEDGGEGGAGGGGGGMMVPLLDLVSHPQMYLHCHCHSIHQSMRGGYGEADRIA